MSRLAAFWPSHGLLPTRRRVWFGVALTLMFVLIFATHVDGGWVDRALQRLAEVFAATFFALWVYAMVEEIGVDDRAEDYPVQD